MFYSYVGLNLYEEAYSLYSCNDYVDIFGGGGSTNQDVVGDSNVESEKVDEKTANKKKVKKKFNHGNMH